MATRRRTRADRPLPRARRLAITQTAERDRLVERAVALYMAEHKRIVEAIGGVLEQYVWAVGTTDAVEDDLAKALRGAFKDPEQQRAAFGRIASLVGADVDVAVHKAIPSVSRSKFAPSGAVQLYARQNAELIKGVGPEIIRHVEKTIASGAGKHVQTLRRDFEQAASISEARAKLWARDQTLKLHGQITRERYGAVGITEYYWTDSNDERVRQVHRDLGDRSDRGETFSFLHPPIMAEDGRRGNPGEDYQCRCTAFPKLEAQHKKAPPKEPEGFDLPEYPPGAGTAALRLLKGSPPEAAALLPAAGVARVAYSYPVSPLRLLSETSNAASKLAQAQVRAVVQAVAVLSEKPDLPVKPTKPNYVSRAQVPGGTKPLTGVALANYQKAIASAERNATIRTAKELEARRAAARALTPEAIAADPQKAAQIVYSTQIAARPPRGPRTKRPALFVNAEEWRADLNALERRALDRRLEGGKLSDPEFNRVVATLKRSPFATIGELLTYWEANRGRTLTAAP